MLKKHRLKMTSKIPRHGANSRSSRIRSIFLRGALKLSPCMSLGISKASKPSTYMLPEICFQVFSIEFKYHKLMKNDIKQTQIAPYLGVLLEELNLFKKMLMKIQNKTFKGGLNETMSWNSAKALTILIGCLTHLLNANELIIVQCWQKFVRPEYPNLSNPKKIEYGQEFFVRILNLDIIFFTFLLSESNFDLNLSLFELSDSKNTVSVINFLFQILTLSDLSDPNLIRTQIFASAKVKKEVLLP